MTNSPHAGGSQVLLIFSSVPVDPDFPCCRHLPDITIISPVFHPEFKKIIFFTASRGHHADIGGILPGSMPPTSVNIFEEGAEILSFKLVKEGIFDSKGLHEHMIDKPAMYPGSSGCRNIRDVESDLKAVSREYFICTFGSLRMPLANCRQPQRNSIASPKYAFSLLSSISVMKWFHRSPYIRHSGGGLRSKNCPRIYVSYSKQCGELCAQPSA